MEAFALYLLKSVIWLSGFALVFILFLRNERFFHLNRIYLISGILTSFLFPFLTIYYTVDLPSAGNVQIGNVVSAGIQEVRNGFVPDTGFILLALYCSGVLFVSYMILKQSKMIFKAIKKAEIIRAHPVKLIRTAEYTSSFSFFSYVFVNPSVTAIETEEILNHEMVHIRQMHWVDLVLVELLCVLQWFNPFIWIYIRFIRQNHEYLADEVALQRTSDPAVYRATLLNQIVGTPVVSLANSFNYSLNKKRFNMMKNIISSPYRKMKIFLILPFFAIVLYAFAKPEYKYISPGVSLGNKAAVFTDQAKVIKGGVTQQDGKPLAGATILIKGTTVGTISDLNGLFKIANVPDDATIVVSYIGFKTKAIKAVFDSDMNLKMVRDTVKLGSISNMPPPPPPPPPGTMGSVSNMPPPPPGSEIKIRGDGPKPLVILDGKIIDIDVNTINPSTIESISVMKDLSSTAAYGEKGKNGVILITTKKELKVGTENKTSEVTVVGYGSSKNEMFVAVEEMPQFPGGEKAMEAWISGNIKYPAEAAKKDITGQVLVNFFVNTGGKVSGVKVNRPVNPMLDAEAIRVISSMPEWKPGKQGGKPVEVYMTVPINFVLGKVVIE